VVLVLPQALPKATTLRFEFFREFSSSGEGADAAAAASGAGKVSIVVPHVERLQESEHAILHQLVHRFHVGKQHRCVLLPWTGVGVGWGLLTQGRAVAGCNGAPKVEEEKCLVANKHSLL